MSDGGRFADQVVFITGAARGQGRAHALAFAREGATLLLCDTQRAYPSVPYALSTPEELEAVAREIESLGQRVIARHVDVTDLVGMERLLDEARSELGPVSIAIANAGLYSFGPTWELSEQQWEEVLSVVLKGVWITCKVAIPHMLSTRQGKIICIGSTGSFRGLPGLGHYVAAKHGVIGLVKTLAIELAPYNINVNAICPTTVDTSIVNNQAFFEYFAGGPGEHATREYVIERMNAMNLLPERGMLDPEDISRVVLWLATEEARHITGCALPVDAGFLTR
jgi:SDR family mycofactocin-dependent oxidoreductase